MSKLKAMVLFGVGVVVIFMVLSTALVLLGGGGDLIAIALGLCAILNGLGLTKVIKHYVAQEERREREARLMLH
ncbi:MAG: hypothetical protein ACHQCI_02420 [Solirubrobacterales bacterium]